MKASALSKVVAILVAVLLAAPTVVVVGTSVSSGGLIQFPPKGLSLHWFYVVVSSPVWRDVALQSAKVGLTAAGISTVVGTALAFGAARGSFIPKKLVAAISVLPILVPSVVAALGFYFVYIGTLGAAGGALTLGVAGATTSVPLTFLYVLAAVEGMDERVEEAAAICGANKRRTFIRVTLPILLPSIITGALFAFLAAWEEIVIATFLAGPGFQTLPLYIYGQSTTTGLEPATSAASVLLMLLTMLFLGLMAVLVRTRSAGART